MANTEESRVRVRTEVWLRDRGLGHGKYLGFSENQHDEGSIDSILDKVKKDLRENLADNWTDVTIDIRRIRHD